LTFVDTALLVAAAFVGATMNSVAGGGSFVTFPALVFAGIPSVTANATSTVALFPASFASAWAYRHDFPEIKGLSARALLAISIAGGILGALLLIFTPEQTFNAVVPWLLLAATLLFAFNNRLIPWLTRHVHIGAKTLGVVQFGIAIYGGYFGGAIGIMMLALFGLLGITNINAANALKTLLGGTLNAVAVVCFVIAGQVAWLPAGIMVLSAIAGGYVGARIARKMNPDHVRAAVILIGAVMTVVFFVRG
jgi:hypothetical protein